jgi:Uma2 family endonuclease
MKVLVVDEQRQLVNEPYVVRMGGWTPERYLQESPDDARWEFVRGEVIMYSPATAEHQDLVGFFYRLLSGYCETKGWGKVLTGPAAVRLFPDVMREPDLFVIAPEDVPKATGTPLDLNPVFIVEVISPSTRTIDLGEKAEDYARAGVPEYWAADRERRELHAHRLQEQEGNYRAQVLSRGRLESGSVPGFWVSIDWLWRSPLPPMSTCLPQILRGL